MLDDFLVRSVLAAIGVAVAAAPIGCFVVWRRMAYFGDATAHAAVLGVALSLLASISVFPAVLIVCVLMALLVSLLTQRGYAMDTLLGVMAHSCLAIGLVAVSFVSGVRIDLMAYLFGDVLAVGSDDLMVIWGGACLVIGLVIMRWERLLLSTLSPDMARAANINPQQEQLVLTLCLSVVVAVAIKVVGVLLITAMLLIPAATARSWTKTPEMMAISALGCAVVASLLGFRSSYVFDAPTGPTIVTVSALLFVSAQIVRRILKKLNQQKNRIDRGETPRHPT